MKNIVKIAIVIGIVGVLVGIALLLQGKPETQAERPLSKPVANQPLTIDAFGVIKAREIHNVIIDFPAYVDKVDVREGQRVKGGDPLVHLNITEYAEQIKSREISLDAERTELQIRRSYQTGQNDPDLNKLYAELHNAENLYNQDLQQMANREALLKAGAVSQNDFNEFKKTVDSRKKAVEDAKLDIESLRFSKATETDKKYSAVSSSASELRVMKNKLSRPFLRGNTVVSGVTNGVVFDLNCAPGDKLGKTDTPQKIMSLLNLDSIVVMADVDEEFIRDVKLGSKVTVTLLADRSRQYQGSVIRIANRAVVKNNETYIPVEITIDNIDEFVLPEMNVDVKIARG